MGQTFSTYLRDLARGEMYSSAVPRERALHQDPSLVQFAVKGARSTGSLTPQDIRFDLDCTQFPPGILTAPGGFAAEAKGSLRLLQQAGKPPQLNLRVEGLRPTLYPGGQLSLWLVRDLPVPLSLDTADRSVIGSAEGNQPGQFYTIDGQAPTLGRADVPQWNTISVAVSPGSCALQPDGTAALAAQWDNSCSLAVDPRALIGLPGIDPDARIPSGLAARMLTAVFMQPVSVLPHLPFSNLAARVEAVAEQVLTAADADGDGQVTEADLVRVPDAYLQPDSFNRVMLTLEPATRTTPSLQPTLAAVLLMGLQARKG